MSDKIPPEIAATLEKFAPHFIRADPNSPPRIAVYCNVCEHEIRQCGNEWKCVEDCRCMMMGCVPKRWTDED